jgi:hypothetical protein
VLQTLQDVWKKYIACVLKKISWCKNCWQDNNYLPKIYSINCLLADICRKTTIDRTTNCNNYVANFGKTSWFIIWVNAKNGIRLSKSSVSVFLWINLTENPISRSICHFIYLYLFHETKEADLLDKLHIVAKYFNCLEMLHWKRAMLIQAFWRYFDKTITFTSVT